MSKRRSLIAALIALFTFLVFLPALWNGFVNWDDQEYVYENSFIRAIDARLFRAAFLEFHSANWHPLTWISHALDYRMWGLNAAGHHLTSIVLHACNTFLVVLLVLRLVETAGNPSQRGLPGFSSDRAILLTGGVTGLLFGLHPLHVESVAWISERKDLLCALFFLITLMTYMKYVGGLNAGNVQRHGVSRFFHTHYLYAMGFYALALLSKPMAVSLPLVLLIVDWYPLNRISSLVTLKDVIIEKLPFLSLSLLSSVVTVLAQQAGGSIAPLEGSLPATRALIGANSLISYLWKIIAPVNLMPFYPYPRDVSLSSPGYVFSILAILCVLALCWGARRKRKFLPAAWCYYVLTLLPVLGIVRVGEQSMADRYMYLPSLGPFLAIGISVAWMYEKVNALHRGKEVLRGATWAIGCLVIISISSLTICQTGIWKNGFTLWDYVIEREPGKVYFAYNNRGILFSEAGRYPSALKDFDTAIALKPDYFRAYNNRGVVFNKEGLFERAIQDFNRAITLYPSSEEAFYNRGIAHDKLGYFDYAMEDFKKAIALNPASEKAYINRGLAFERKGFYDEAIGDYSKALSLSPYSCSAYNNRGTVYYKRGQLDQALEDYSRAIALCPGFSEAYYNRAMSYYKKGFFDKAQEDLRRSAM